MHLYTFYIHFSLTLQSLHNKIQSIWYGLQRFKCGLKEYVKIFCTNCIILSIISEWHKMVVFISCIAYTWGTCYWATVPWTYTQMAARIHISFSFLTLAVHSTALKKGAFNTCSLVNLVKKTKHLSYLVILSNWGSSKNIAANSHDHLPWSTTAEHAFLNWFLPHCSSDLFVCTLTKHLAEWLQSFI